MMKEQAETCFVCRVCRAPSGFHLVNPHILASGDTRCGPAYHPALIHTASILSPCQTAAEANQVKQAEI